MGRARDSYVATYRATALAYCLLLTAAGGPTQVRFEEDHEAVSPQVSKTPSWPRKFGQLQPFHGCTRTGMHGPTSIFWANLTPFSLAVPAHADGLDTAGRARCDGRVLESGERSEPKIYRVGPEYGSTLRLLLI